jgi:glycosyltransferase involved in cell wall biosynthesis
VLLLSAYDAPSQRYWREGLAARLPEFEFTQLVLPPRHFNWRVRGNSLSWAFGERHTLEAPYDLLLATATVDLSALRGFVPALARLPTLVYFHENQFTYPLSGRGRHSVEPAIVNLYTALCADRLAFNSRWNRDSFLAGVVELGRRLPDGVPPGIEGRLARRSEVLPVAVEAAGTVRARSPPPLDLVWNHRWEYDKGPAGLLALLRELVRQRLPVRLHVVGQQFRRAPPEFDAVRVLLEAQPALAGQFGYLAAREDYLALLGRAHVVLSTALHEFQGLAVIEAGLRGCLPLVPDRLAYPETVPAVCRYPSTPGDPAAEGRAMAGRLAQWLSDWPRAVPSLSERLQGYTWAALEGAWRRLLADTLEAGVRTR